MRAILGLSDTKAAWDGLTTW